MGLFGLDGVQGEVGLLSSTSTTFVFVFLTVGQHDDGFSIY